MPHKCNSAAKVPLTIIRVLKHEHVSIKHLLSQQKTCPIAFCNTCCTMGYKRDPITTIFVNEQPIAITKHATAATAWPPAAAAAQAFRRSSAMHFFLNQSASRPQKLLSQR
jgi:hypothetical protein